VRAFVIAQRKVKRKEKEKRKERKKLERDTFHSCHDRNQMKKK